MRTIAAIVIFALVSIGVAQQVRAWPSVRSVDTKTYDSSSDAVVAIDDPSGDVSVSGWDRDRIEVTTTKTAWSNDDLRRLGERVDAHRNGFSIVAEFPSHCMNCDVSFKIRVPSRAHVTVETSSGDVRVTSLSGPARVDSASGDVELTSIAGETHVHSSSGDIALTAIGSSVDAYTSSGDISARKFVADANLVASSGSVSAEYARFDAVNLVRMESSSGDISLTVPRGVGFKIEATTASGSIQSNLHLPVRERDSGADVLAQVGEGKASVQLRATSGDIGITMR